METNIPKLDEVQEQANEESDNKTVNSQEGLNVDDEDEPMIVDVTESVTQKTESIASLARRLGMSKSKVYKMMKMEKEGTLD